MGGCEGSLLFRSGVTFIFGTHGCPACSGAGQPVQHLPLCFPPAPIAHIPLVREQPPDPRAAACSSRPRASTAAPFEGAQPQEPAPSLGLETQLGQAFCCLQKLAALAGDASPPHPAVCSFHICHFPSFGCFEGMLGAALCQASRKAAVGAASAAPAPPSCPSGTGPAPSAPPGAGQVALAQKRFSSDKRVPGRAPRSPCHPRPARPHPDTTLPPHPALPLLCGEEGEREGSVLLGKPR